MKFVFKITFRIKTYQGMLIKNGSSLVQLEHWFTKRKMQKYLTKMSLWHLFSVLATDLLSCIQYFNYLFFCSGLICNSSSALTLAILPCSYKQQDMHIECSYLWFVIVVLQMIPLLCSILLLGIGLLSAVILAHYHFHTNCTCDTLLPCFKLFV